MNEKEVSSQFVAAFKDRFDLFPEVILRHPFSGQSLRIDFIGFDKRSEIIGPIGFEVKDPQVWSGKFSAFTAALAQCVDYQDCVINGQFSDEKYNVFYGMRPRFTFLLPVACSWAYSFRRSAEAGPQWAAGALRLAGKFGVGAGCFDEYQGWILTLGTERAYSVSSGISDLMKKHWVADRSGSSR